jgi:glutaredoxin 3
MKKITIYTTNVCPYCVRAKALLNKKNYEYEEINVENEQDRNLMIEKANGKRSVPQIFIEDYHVGGCDELYELDRDGKLEGLI